MLSSIYIFFSSVTLILLFLAFYDWGATKQKAAGFPSLCAMFLSLIMFSVSWKVTALSGGVEFAALSGWESYAIALLWFLFAMVSFILTLMIYLEKPKDLGV